MKVRVRVRVRVRVDVDLRQKTRQDERRSGKDKRQDISGEK